MFDELSLVLEIGRAEGRTLERLVSPTTLDASDPDVGGAVIDASYAVGEPELLPRLHDHGISYVLNPQAYRFADTSYQSVRALQALSYAPDRPLDSASWSTAHETMVQGALEAQAKANVDFYVVPSLPLRTLRLPETRSHGRLHAYAAGLNGKLVPKRPMVASVYPSLAVMKSPYAVFEPIRGYPWAAVLVQPLLFHPKSDSVGKLTAYVRFLSSVAEYGLPAIAARSGPFALVLHALGVPLSTSGFGDKHGFDLRALERPKPVRKDDGSQTGSSRMVYLSPLLTAVPERDARRILSNTVVRSRFECAVEGCRTAGYAGQYTQPRQHFVHAWHGDLAEVRSLPTIEMRVDYVFRRLQAAAELGSLVRERVVLEENRRFKADHLLTWRAVLTDRASVLGAAKAASL